MNLGPTRHIKSINLENEMPNSQAVSIAVRGVAGRVVPACFEEKAFFVKWIRFSTEVTDPEPVGCAPDAEVRSRYEKPANY